MSSLLVKPWHTLHHDFCGPFPHGEYLLVVIDAYSRFPEVDINQSTSTTAVISKLEHIFASHGYPRIIHSNNCPPFASREINEYMKENASCIEELILFGHKQTLK